MEAALKNSFTAIAGNITFTLVNMFDRGACLSGN